MRFPRMHPYLTCTPQLRLEMAQGEGVWWGELRHILMGSGFQWVNVTTLCTGVVEDKQPRLTLKPVQTGSGRMCLQLGSPDKAQLHSICVKNGCI